MPALLPEANWAPLVGVVLGFLLSQLATLASWLATQRRERRLARMLVSLEIDHNLSLLRDYWHNVSLPPDEEAEGQNAEIEANRLARRAVELPLPVLSDRAVHSQLRSLPRMLSEEEIRRTWRMYEDIAQVRALHAWLVALTTVPGAGEDSFPSASRTILSGGLLSATFATRRAGAIFDLKGTVLSLLEQGNPLRQPKDSVS